MKVLVVGGGGREHAIIKKLKESKNVSELFATPGNGGIATDCECVNIGAKDIDAIVSFAVEKSIDFAVVAPDDPLVLGAVDRLNEKGIPCFGPNKRAAIIEGSKAFSKNLMKKYNIPTSSFEIFDDCNKALEYIDSINDFNTPLVCKADGLALGKGVLICDNLDQAKDAIKSIMQDKAFGNSGNVIVIEEFLTGPEVSVLAFTDGKVVVPMVSSMDHKRAFDGDKGLNTGGMGVIAPNPYYTLECQAIAMEKIFLPTINAMNSEDRKFKGCLYFGLMITDKGVKVIEYNCRFGDPETQVVLPLLKSDLLDIMIACENETLSEQKIVFEDKSACCVVLASKGYPEKYETGFPIYIDEDIKDSVYIAGGKLDGENLLTAGGRVLGVTAIADTLADAIELSYQKVKKVKFENAFYRNDIGKKALNV